MRRAISAGTVNSARIFETHFQARLRRIEMLAVLALLAVLTVT
jgi:hypothetical protein